MTAATTPRNPRRVKGAFLGWFAAVIVILMGLFATAIYLVEAKVRDRDLAERSTAAAQLVDVKLGKDSNLMRAVVHAMKGNAALESAFRRRNREALEQHARALFETLRRDHRITHLYFTLPDRINLYRLHTPSLFGDRIDRATLLQAYSRKEAVHGLELGPLGTLTLRLVMPWGTGSDMLGFVELGEEIQHVIGEVRESLAVDLLVLVNKRFVEQEQWQRGQTMMQRQGDWGRFSSHVLLAQTVPQLPEAFDERVLAHLLGGRTAKIDEDGRALHMALLPLSDAGGRPIGKLAVLRDTTQLEGTFQAYMAWVVLLSLGVAAGVFGVFYVALGRVEQDYHRQHELERRLLNLDTEHRRILQLEKLSALGTMVGGVAHQLNNPLVGVVNMAQLAERATDDARLRELLGEIRRAGIDCRDYVRRMLEFSKVSSLERKPTPMRRLIEDTVLMFRQTETRHLPVDVQLPDGEPELEVDPILIRHALFNLLLNAAQATAGMKGIRIDLERQANPADGAPGWSLSVLDQGHGVPPEGLDRIFDPFFTTRTEGTGLGLPVVQHVALLHQGFVAVANQPQGGARFSIWLPLSATA